MEELLLSQQRRRYLMKDISRALVPPAPGVPGVLHRFLLSQQRQRYLMKDTSPCLPPALKSLLCDQLYCQNILSSLYVLNDKINPKTMLT